MEKIDRGEGGGGKWWRKHQSMKRRKSMEVIGCM
jgi:hypothetical protein